MAGGWNHSALSAGIEVVAKRALGTLSVLEFAAAQVSRGLHAHDALVVAVQRVPLVASLASARLRVEVSAGVRNFFAALAHVEVESH